MIGTRGDVMPGVPVCLALEKLGHRTLFASLPNYRESVAILSHMLLPRPSDVALSTPLAARAGNGAVSTAIFPKMRYSLLMCADCDISKLSAFVSVCLPWRVLLLLEVNEMLVALDSKRLTKIIGEKGLPWNLSAVIPEDSEEGKAQDPSCVM
eukprot:1449189-Amphidinium_carterae.1